MSHRGEHAEIETFVGQSVDSELSGNMIDICPVGALTSKPFRYSARTWELSRRKSVSPHDSTGANLIVQVKNHKVHACRAAGKRSGQRMLDRRPRPLFLRSAEQRRAPDRTHAQAGRRVEDGRLADRAGIRGQWPASRSRPSMAPSAIGLLASPHSTVEELALAGALVRGLGSENIDSRLRHADFSNAAAAGQARWLGHADRRPVTSCSVCWWWVPTCARTIRCLRSASARPLARARRSTSLTEQTHDWAMPVKPIECWPTASVWVAALAGIAAAVVAEAKGVQPPVAGRCERRRAARWPNRCSAVNSKAILLGNAAAHHEKASSLLALANWIAEQTGASRGLPHRSRQHGGRPAGGRCAGAGWPECRSDARQAAQGGAAAEHRSRRPTAPRAPTALTSSRHGGHAQPVQGQPGHQRCAAADRAVHAKPRARSSTPKAVCRVSTPWCARWVIPARPGRCCACWAICWACRL